MMGYDLNRKAPIAELPHMQFGRCLAEQGYVVVCCEAFPFNTVPEPQPNQGFAWWQAAADKLLADHPRWTGIGKLTADVGRAVDLLLAQPRMDANRIAAVGHSLGGKMAFTAGALDDRVKAVIGSDFGMGWDFSNWDAPWYYGSQVRNPCFRWGNHHLLSAMAPRPFLLVGGEFDKPESRQYLAAARPVYALYGQPESLGFLYHAAGHRPPPAAMRAACQWLAEQFDLPAEPPPAVWPAGTDSGSQSLDLFLRRCGFVRVYSVFRMLPGPCTPMRITMQTASRRVLTYLPWDDAPVDLSFLFAGGGGRHGFLQARRLVRFRMASSRFGASISTAPPISSHTHSEIVARSAWQFGVNLVRFRQLDGDWSTPNIFQFTRGPA